MAWEWSHTAEAYEIAQENLFHLDRVTLEVIYAEWQARCGDNEFDPDFDSEAYEQGLKEAKGIATEDIVDYIWTQAEALYTCDNGGWNAWVCPWGCHTVPFSRPEED